MKDYGFEADHLKLVERHGLQSQTCWMSWIPPSLVRLRELGATGPLILAHCNLTRLSTVGDWLHAALSRVDVRMLHLALRGVDHASTAPEFAHGFQHGLVCTRLPVRFERLLAESEGGVCVHRSLVGAKLARYCHEAGLQLWVFRVGTPAAYAHYAADKRVNKVCCDDAPGVLRLAATAEC